MRTPLWVHLLRWVKLPCDFRGQSCGHFIGRTWTEEQGAREFFPPLSRMAHFLKPLRTKDGHFLLKEWVFGIVGWSLDVGHWEGSRRPWGLQTTFSSDPYRKGCCVCVEGEISWKGFVPHACFNQSSPIPGFYLLVLSTDPVTSLEMRRLSLRRGHKWMWLYQGVREDSTGHEKFIFIFWGGRMPRGRRHTKKRILSPVSAQRLSGPLSLEGNVLIALLSSVPWWPFPKDAVIDEGVAQILRGALVNILLLVKGQTSSRPGLLPFPLYFISTEVQPWAKSVFHGRFPSISCVWFSYMAAPAQPLAHAARVLMLLRELSLLRHAFSAPHPRVTPDHTM